MVIFARNLRRQHATGKKLRSKKMVMIDIDLNDYYYDLPSDRIAQYPVNERDRSQLLVYKGNKISKDTFKNLGHYLPQDSLLVFNNTRVIRARILFRKESGAAIEMHSRKSQKVEGGNNNVLLYI
jgi:S-adenosylmethionine:tRNA ribosyltransferase-isomerase